MKASKLQVLEFIKERQLVWVYEVVQKFGYTDHGARIRLIRLKKSLASDKHDKRYLGAN